VYLTPRRLTDFSAGDVPTISQVVANCGSEYGEMSEWSIEHAWKLIPAALSNTHRHAPTNLPSTTSRNNNSSTPELRIAVPAVEGRAVEHRHVALVIVEVERAGLRELQAAAAALRRR